MARAHRVRQVIGQGDQFSLAVDASHRQMGGCQLLPIRTPSHELLQHEPYSPNTIQSGFDFDFVPQQRGHKVVDFQARNREYET